MFIALRLWERSAFRWVIENLEQVINHSPKNLQKMFLAPGFQAFFNTELGTYNYSQGIVHVSSFGFGGTNAHAIFWGEERMLVAFSAHLWLGLAFWKPSSMRFLFLRTFLENFSHDQKTKKNNTARMSTTPPAAQSSSKSAFDKCRLRRWESMGATLFLGRLEKKKIG